MSSACRTLVTGASGFIGQRLCERLRDAGHRVTALMRQSSDGPWQHELHLDLSNSKTTIAPLSGIDIVFHLASRVHETDEIEAPAGAFEALNVEGTKRLLDAALLGDVKRFVYFSSVKALGEGSIDRLTDQSPPRPCTPYGSSKLAAEALVLDWGRRHKKHVSILRLPLVYGPRSKGNLQAMLRAVRDGKFPPIPETNNRRSLVHVEDVVSAALLAAHSDVANGKAYLLTDGHTYSTREMFEMMCHACARPVPHWVIPRWILSGAARIGDSIEQILGIRAPVNSDRLEKLLGSAYYDSSRIADDLGFKPKLSLSEALPEMVESL